MKNMYIDILDLEIENSSFIKLSKYLEILLFWQKSINLVSKDTIPDIWNRHFYDSLQIIKEMRPIEHLKSWQDRALNIFDLGTGAGFPGLVLAIVDSKNQYYLIESNAKKTAFLLEVIRSLSLNNVVIVNKRIEDFVKDKIKANIIVSRGLSKLGSLVESSKLLGFEDVVCIFLKGKNYLQEIEDLKYKNLNLSLHISTKRSLINNEGRIIIIKDNYIHKRPS